MSHTGSSTAETDCPPVSRLEMMAHGNLPDPGLTLCLSHLKTCEACSARLSALLDSPQKPRFRWVELDLPATVFMPELPAQPDKGPALDPPLVPGDLGSIGAIRLLNVIGNGHTAIAYSGFDTRLDRAVVVKVLLPRLARVPQLAEEFFAEGRAAARLEHPGIVPILWVDTFKGLPFIVMPQLRGESLAFHLAKGPMSPVSVRDLLPQVIDALELAHSKNLVHRDIKPANMWLHRDTHDQRRVVLLDFGIAGQFNSKGLSSGTRGYRSPEQAAGEPCDHRSDFFSLGCVLFEMLTGRRAWPPNGGMETVEPLAADPAVPAAWKPLLRALLRWDPARRPATHAALRALIPPEAPARGRWLAPVAAAGGMLLLMVTFGIAWMMLWKPGPRPGAPYDLPKDGSTEWPSPASPAVAVSPGLKPRMVIPGGKNAVLAVSGNGSVLARADQAGRVEIVSTLDGVAKGAFVVGGRIRRLSANQAGTLLAVALESNAVHVHRVPDGVKERTFPFGAADGREAWVGKDNSTLMILENGNLRMSRGPDRPGNNEMSLLAPRPRQSKAPLQAVDFAAHPGSDHVAVLFAGRSLGVMNLASGKMVQFDATLPFISQQPSIEWRNPATPVVICERKVMEYEMREKGPRDLSMWELPISALAFVWTGENEYAVVSDSGGRVPAVYLGRRGGRGQRTELFTDGAWIDRLQWVPETRTLLAFGRDGSVRLFDIPGQ